MHVLHQGCWRHGCIHCVLSAGEAGEAGQAGQAGEKEKADEALKQTHEICFTSERHRRYAGQLEPFQCQRAQPDLMP